MFAQNHMQVDHSRPHPFRRYPAGHPRAGEALMGYTRLLLVVADGQGELIYDAENDLLKVRPAADADGLARARWEIPKYRNLVDAGGGERDRPDTKRTTTGWIRRGPWRNSSSWGRSR